MRYYEVAPTRIVRSGSNVFTYHSDVKLQIGSVVTIPVGDKEHIGVVMGEVKKPTYTTKPVTDTVISTPIPRALLNTALWMQTYYSTPLALVLQTLLPSGIQKKRRARTEVSYAPIRKRTNIVFNKDQQKALKDIRNTPSGSIILQGITGSGKTELYKQVARDSIKAGRSVIVLVPEISLTTQLIDEFRQDFPDIIITHSKLTEAERHLAWQSAIETSTPRVVLGPRSALFLPLKDIGAIIIDEAHEPSYKQGQAPRYSALRVATVLGAEHAARVIFGSATPSITDRYLAEANKKPVVHLNTLARPNAKPPKIEVVNMTQKESRQAHSIFSAQFISGVKQALKNGHQALIFHNRRGSAQVTLCKECGWSALCPHCFIPLVLHSDSFTLRCHSCNYQEKVPTHCPTCSSVDIIHKGVGTKRIETELQALFPSASIARFDSDNKDNESAHALYDKLYKGDVDIIIGTQVIAKGLDLPYLRFVGVVQADTGLMLPDFAATERTFQLISQVIGRVGRSEHESHVVIQSYRPEHPAIQAALQQDYERFYTATLEDRKKGHFPPFSYLLQLTNTYKTESGAITSAKKLAALLKKSLPKTVVVLGPTPAFYERMNGTYRWQILLKSSRREYLQKALELVPAAHWQADLDPSSLL